MANQQHVDLIQQGAENWNKWRQQHPDICPDLSGVDLDGAELDGANLSGADLRGTNLSRAYLSTANIRGADLREAILIETDLCFADLRGADLSRANLGDADFREADLREVNLNRADLGYADLSGANLSKADLGEARVGYTSFGDLDLREVKGLETVFHEDPSHIGIDTLEHSGGDIPEVFMQGAGMSDASIAYARSLKSNPIEYYTCFISYSSKDSTFAEGLHADLQQKGVRCWFAPEDMDIGDKIRPRIDESICHYDKLVLILSQASIESTWVAYEVERALNKEPAGIPNVLYPIRLDDAVMQCNASWVQDIRSTRHIGDFTRWKDPDAYQQAFNRLLRALKSAKRGA